MNQQKQVVAGVVGTGGRAGIKVMAVRFVDIETVASSGDVVYTLHHREDTQEQASHVHQNKCLTHKNTTKTTAVAEI